MRRTSIDLLLALCLLLMFAAPGEAGWEEGVAAFEAGKYAEAARQFEAVAQERPDWPGGYLMHGRCLLKLKRPQEAVAPLRKAYDLNPNDDPTKISLAQAYLEARRYSDAAQLLQTIDASKLPGQQRAAYHQMLAAAHSKSGQTDEALSAIKNAAQASPNDAEIQHQCGSLALASGETATAIRALEKAVSLDGSDLEKKRTLVKALIRRGRETRGAEKTQNYARAVAVAQQVATKTNAYDDFLTLGEAQLGAKAYADSASTLLRAAQLNAEAFFPLYYLGQAQTALGQFPQAVATLRQALPKTGSSQNERLVWAQLGFVYEKQKDFANAKAAYQRIGDQASLTRVAENERITEENKLIEEQNLEIERLKEEAAELEAQMKDLPPE